MGRDDADARPHAMQPKWVQIEVGGFFMGRRTIQNMAASRMIDDEEMHEAWDRVARTEDGKKIYLHLQKRLMAVASTGDDSTLRADNGERMFAAKLIGLMAKGIAESGGRTDSILTFSVAGPRAVSRPHGAGRRITADTAVPGYDAEPRSGS